MVGNPNLGTHVVKATWLAMPTDEAAAAGVEDDKALGCCNDVSNTLRSPIAVTFWN